MMTREEAIRILDPETRREALQKIPVMERIETDQEACRMAVAALRDQQDVKGVEIDPFKKLDRSWRRYCPACDPEHRGCQTCVYAAKRSDLEPCKSCAKRYADSEGEELPGYVDANYCPFCGRPLIADAR